MLLLILPWFKFQDSYMLDLFFNRYLLILCRTHVYKKNVSVIFKYIISYLIMSVKLNGKFSKNINAIVFYDISRSMFLHFFLAGDAKKLLWWWALYSSFSAFHQRFSKIALFFSCPTIISIFLWVPYKYMEPFHFC